MNYVKPMLSPMLLVLLSIHCGCGKLEITPGEAEEPVADHLRAVVATPIWVLSSMTVDGVTSQPLKGSPVTISFSADQFHGHTGCNHFSGSFTAKPDGTLQWGNEMSVTEMACFGGRMQQERAVLAALAKVDNYRVAATSLVLSDTSAANVLKFVPAVQSAVPLAGTLWRLTHFTESDGQTDSALSVLAEHPIHLKITNQQATGSGGCNEFACVVKHDKDGRVTFQRISSTEMAGSKPAMEQEQRFFRTLSKISTYTIRENVLVLEGQDGTIGLQFEAQSDRDDQVKK